MLPAERFPILAGYPRVCTWLTVQANLGLASTTLDAYSRALIDYLTFCNRHQVVSDTATLTHVAAYVHDLATRQVSKPSEVPRFGLSNATMHQRLVAIRLYYDYLIEEGSRADNPVRRGVYTAGKGFGGTRPRALIPVYQKLPWIPTDLEWQAVLEVVKTEPFRNRTMFALAYDAGLRREELCSLQTRDIDPAYRMISLRAETTKNRRGRVVPYSLATNQLLAAYLQQRRLLSPKRGLLFLSESRRNLAQPISIWTWSKVVHSIAQRAGVPQFTTHTLRHLCLTDLARSGWDIHQIATFAGHRNTDTTLLYIHLSGRDLAAKLEQSMNCLHNWRVQIMKETLK